MSDFFFRAKKGEFDFLVALELTEHETKVNNGNHSIDLTEEVPDYESEEELPLFSSKRKPFDERNLSFQNSRSKPSTVRDKSDFGGEISTVRQNLVETDKCDFLAANSTSSLKSSRGSGRADSCSRNSSDRLYSARDDIDDLYAGDSSSVTARESNSLSRYSSASTVHLESDSEEEIPLVYPKEKRFKRSSFVGLNSRSKLSPDSGHPSSTGAFTPRITASDIPSTSSSRSSVGRRKNMFACDDEYQSLDDDDRMGATSHSNCYQSSNGLRKGSSACYDDIPSTSSNGSLVGHKKRLSGFNDENQSLDFHRAGATARIDQNSSLDNQRIDATRYGDKPQSLPNQRKGASSYHGGHGQFDTDLYEDRGETSDNEILPMVQHHYQKSYQPPKPRDKMYGTLGTNLSYVPKINPEDIPRSVLKKKRQQVYSNDRIHSKPHR